MIQAKNIVAGYGKKVLIKNLSCSFKEGSLSFILGKNGCGKSTLLKLLSGLLHPMEGVVQLEGKDIFQYANKMRAKKIAYLPQNRAIPSITVERMVMHGRFPYLSYPRRYSKEDYEIAQNSLEQVGMKAFQYTRMDQLSGGERQKVYIAMLLAQKAEVILLDEPTTFLDMQSQFDMIRLMKKLRESNKTVIAVIHDISAALQTADHIIVMSDGEIVEKGKPELIYKSGILETVFQVKPHKLFDEEGREHYYFSEIKK